MDLNKVLKRKVVEIALRKGLYRVCGYKLKGKLYKFVYASVNNIESGFDHFIPLGVVKKIQKVKGKSFDLVFFHPLDIEEHAPAAEKICKIDKLNQIKSGRIAVKI
jgi:hypothetical protein